MSKIIMNRLHENLESLKMKNTLDTLDNYLERAVKDNLNIVEVLDCVLHHCAIINIKGESYKLKERKEFMKKKQRVSEQDMGSGR